ncbi:class I SAM-dependent methyltransferase [Patescibacteria group bacterium]|nr:class I SAM-dependent methyltransferase [Patescibacteria group bacterium]
MDPMNSRFFTTKDARSDNLLLPLHPAWWSRSYEYAWAGAFAEAEDTVLDAACGIEHPFKFYLLDRTREVHACDTEEGILVPDIMRKGIRNTYGEAAAARLPERYLRDIHFRQASITDLPYADGTFDKIFCISVLEHLKDHFNRYSWLPRAALLQSLLKREIFLALGEFRRTLKDDGLIVLTFDYPNINLDYLTSVVKSIGLSFTGDVDFMRPDDALYSESLKLYCLRVVLKKTNKGFKP